MRQIIIVIFIIGSTTLYSQFEDNFWFFGSHGLSAEWTGINKFDFSNDLFSKTRITDKIVKYNFTCSVLTDKNGDLILSSNGMEIFDKNLDYITGGEKINFNSYWLANQITLGNGSKRQLGLKHSQGLLMLPWPDRDSVMWICPNYIANGNINVSYSQGLFFGIVDIATDKPRVILKDSLLTKDSITSNGITACQHANGRDWWIIVGNHNRSKLYIYLLDPSGLHRIHETKTNLDYVFGLGQAVFSPLGDKFVIYEVIGAFGYLDQGHFSIFDFDRCTGELSNHRYKPFIGGEFLVGCAISNDGRYLYTSNLRDLYQYDLRTDDIFATEKLVAKGDRFHSYYSDLDSVENFFTFLQLAPDGKIYSPGGNTLHMHRMEYPDEDGDASTMNQHALQTVSNASTIPNMPFFRLGPEDGSSCDTLDIDNKPIAKYRYEGDTLDHLKVRFTDLSYFRPETWHWDFSDGTTFDGKKPYWHAFPKNGVYNVCLTVSNENSENKTCRLVTIGTSSINNDPSQLEKEIVSVFPNPTQGEVLLTLSDYIPEYGIVEVYNINGRLVSTNRVFYGWNNLDLTTVEAGTYFYIVKDGLHKISEGKIVKI